MTLEEQLINKGIQRGIEQGIQQGRLLGMQYAIEFSLKQKFGEKGLGLVEKVYALAKSVTEKITK